MSLTLVIVALGLLAAALVAPAALEAFRARRGRPPGARARPRRGPGERLTLADPGRERRAEGRARELLRSCVNEEEWAMYRDLGFIRVFGRPSQRPRRRRHETTAGEAVVDRSDENPATAGHAGADPATTPTEPGRPRARRSSGEPSSEEGAVPSPPSYAYLLYPHKPVVAYEPETHRLLSEYCVEFSDLSDAVTGSRLPDSDDVLAKWMALTGDEERLLLDANMHLPGRQVDPGRVRRDLWRLGEWERRRRSAGTSPR